MTRDEARALIAGEAADFLAHGDPLDRESLALADCVLAALFAQADPEYRVVDKDGRSHGCCDPMSSREDAGADASYHDREHRRRAPHRVQVRRVVFVSDEWRDETDG